MSDMFPHTNRVEALLQAGKIAEARRLHNHCLEEQRELAKNQPINLSDLLAAMEAFVIDEIEKDAAARVETGQNVGGFDDPTAASRPDDCGRPHPQPFCVCKACEEAMLAAGVKQHKEACKQCGCRRVFKQNGACVCCGACRQQRS